MSRAEGPHAEFSALGRGRFQVFVAPIRSFFLFKNLKNISPPRFCASFQQLNNVNCGKKIVNHFEFHREITMKSGLLKNLQQFSAEIKMNIFEITPTTFLINLLDTNWDYEVQRFLEFFLKYQPKVLQNGKQKLDFKKKMKSIGLDRNFK